MSDTRERILEAAATAFAANGFRSSTVRTIALAAKVNDITVFRYFPKKTDLYWKAIDRGVRQSECRERLEEAITEAENPGDLVRRLSVQISRIVDADPTLARLLQFTVLELDRERKLMLDVHFRPILSKLIDRVRAWKTTGIIRDVDPTNATWALVGVLVAHAGLRSILGESAPNGSADEVAVEFADICVGGIAIHHS